MELRGKGMNWVNEGILLTTRKKNIQKDKNTSWKEKWVPVTNLNPQSTALSLHGTNEHLSITLTDNRGVVIMLP